MLESLETHQAKVQIVNIDTFPIREIELIYSIRDVLQQLEIDIQSFILIHRQRCFQGCEELKDLEGTPTVRTIIYWQFQSDLISVQIQQPHGCIGNLPRHLFTFLNLLSPVALR